MIEEPDVGVEDEERDDGDGDLRDQPGDEEEGADQGGVADPLHEDGDGESGGRLGGDVDDHVDGGDR